MKTEQEIAQIYQLLGEAYPQYRNSQPDAKIHKDAYKSQKQSVLQDCFKQSRKTSLLPHRS